MLLMHAASIILHIFDEFAQLQYYAVILCM